MEPASDPNVSRLLEAWGAGDPAALDQLMPLVYDQLRRIAHRHLGRERAGHTLQTSALVNEAYLKLVREREMRWQNRAHFFAIAARLMRLILVDYARGRNRARRGGGARRGKARFLVARVEVRLGGTGRPRQRPRGECAGHAAPARATGAGSLGRSPAHADRGGGGCHRPPGPGGPLLARNGATRGGRIARTGLCHAGFGLARNRRTGCTRKAQPC